MAAVTPDGVSVPIRTKDDIAQARRAAGRLMRELHFDRVTAESVLLTVAELGTNLLRYGTDGVLRIDQIPGERGIGVRVESRDNGPGIADIERALEDGFSTGGGLGHGLPSVRRLMDRFDISTSPTGTTVTACKWPAHR